MLALGVKLVGTCGSFFFFFCEDHCWFFVIINQCKKQSLGFGKLYVCVCIYIYVASLGMCFIVIYQKLRYNTLQVVIWKLWYYSLYGTIFFQTRLYGSLFITTTDYVQVDFFQYRLYGCCYCGMIVMVCASNFMEYYFSKPDYMKFYLLLLQIVSKQIFPIQCMKVVIVEWLLWYAQVINN